LMRNWKNADYHPRSWRAIMPFQCSAKKEMQICLEKLFFIFLPHFASGLILIIMS